MPTKKTKPAVAVEGGSYRFVNLYWTSSGQVNCGTSTFRTLDGARGGRVEDGTFICTIRVCTKVEVA